VKKRSIAMTLVLALTSFGLANGYDVNVHEVVDRERITCLKLGITWSSIEEYEEKWGRIPQIQHGIVSAGKITETAELRTIRIYLKDPDGRRVEIIKPRTIHDVHFEPPGCISTGFLELLDITEDTPNGRWTVVWEQDGREVFSEEFLVGE